MIKVICETFEWGWYVNISRVAGLKETLLYESRWVKRQFVSTPGDAIRATLHDAQEHVRYDLPEPLSE